MIELTHLSSLLKTLGDATRLRVVHLLRHEELTVGELVRILDLPQSTVSRHLKPLREQGLIADRPHGSATYYRAVLEADTGNGETGLRDALAATLLETPLPPADARRLDQVLALRQGEGEDFFDRIGQRWDALREDCFGPGFHLEAMIHLLPSDWAVADLGTGTGYLLPPLARHFERVIGVDMSEPMLAIARQQMEAENLDNVDLRAGRLEALPMEDGEIDLALAVLMFHHLDDLEAGYGEIRRTLKPGGRLLAVEIHPHENERFRAQMADRRRGIDRETLCGELGAAGFKIDGAWDFPAPDRPEHDLSPLPGIYGVVARRISG